MVFFALLNDFRTAFTVTGEQGSIAKGHSQDPNDNAHKSRGYYRKRIQQGVPLSSSLRAVAGHFITQTGTTYICMEYQRTSESKMQFWLEYFIFFSSHLEFPGSTVEPWGGGAGVTLRPGAKHQARCYQYISTNHLAFPQNHGN